MRAPAFNAWRQLPRVVWVLVAGALISRLGGFVVPFLAIYLSEQRGLGVSEVGLVLGFWGAGVIVAGPVGGALADRIGRRPTLVLSLLLAAAALLHMGMARHTAHLAGAALLLGAVGDLYRPALAAAIADVVPPADRIRAYGLLYWANNLGFSIAASLAGWLAARRFEILFVGNALAVLLFAAVAWFWFPETRPAVSSTAPRANPLAPARDRRFVSFAALILLISVVFAQFMVTMPLDMRQHGVPKEQYGLLIALNGLLILLIQPFASEHAHRFRPAHVMAVSALLIGLGFGAMGLAQSAPAYAVTIAIWTLGEIAMSPVGPAVVADLAAVELRGVYQGAYQFAMGAGIAVGPALGAAVHGALGGGVLWTGCAVLGALVAVGHLARGRG